MIESAKLVRDGLGIYLSCLGRSLIPHPDRPSPSRPRRLFFCLILFPAFLVLQMVHWICLSLDELFFPEYRQTGMINPVWITGIPRSGTTFVHRQLARDREAFTTMQTWECLLAPSIIQKKILLNIRALDRKCGRPLARGLDRATSKVAGPVAEIHEISLTAPEEDYLALLPAAGCFFLYLAFPFSEDLRDLARLEAMPDNRRDRLLDFYDGLIRKHLFVFGGDEKRFLAKNAAFASWVPFLADRYPDAAFILQIRDPQTALPSQVSSIRDALVHFGIEREEADVVGDFSDLWTDGLAGLKTFLQQHPQIRTVLIDQSDLKSHPAIILDASFRRLDIPVSEHLKSVLESLQSGHRSDHHHHFPSGMKINDCLMAEYQQMLELPQRISPN